MVSDKRSPADPGHGLIGPYSGLPVLVTGASGFIGRNFVSRLEGAGAKVIRAARAEFDLSEPTAVREIVTEAQPAIVFNLAAYGVHAAQTDERLAESLNHALVSRLCGALQDSSPRQGWHGQRLVHVGSALEYGRAGGDLNEATPPEPTTVYGRTKLAGTQVVTTYGRNGLRAVTARLFTVYGPGERPGRLLPSLLAAAASGTRLELTAGDQRRDFTYVGDVVDSLLALGLAPARTGEVINVATGRLTSVRRFVEIAAAELGIPFENLGFGVLPARSWEMSHRPVRVERLRELTGSVPSTTIAEGVRKSLDAQRRNDSSSTPK